MSKRETPSSFTFLQSVTLTGLIHNPALCSALFIYIPEAIRWNYPELPDKRVDSSRCISNSFLKPTRTLTPSHTQVLSCIMHPLPLPSVSLRIARPRGIIRLSGYVLGGATASLLTPIYWDLSTSSNSDRCTCNLPRLNATLACYHFTPGLIEMSFLIAKYDAPTGHCRLC